MPHGLDPLLSEEKQNYMELFFCLLFKPESLFFPLIFIIRELGDATGVSITVLNVCSENRRYHQG